MAASQHAGVSRATLTHRLTVVGHEAVVAMMMHGGGEENCGL